MSEPTSPLATPASSPATPAAPTAPTSPFATPPPGQAAPAAPAASGSAGDTSFINSISAREPLIKGCVVPGVIAAIARRTSETSGNEFLSVTVTLYGDNMIFEDGTPVSKGKQITSTWYASAKDAEKLVTVARKLKNLQLALHNVAMDGSAASVKAADATYASWPADQQLVKSGFLSLSLAPFEPTDKWMGTRVMVQVRPGKDTDGNPRNEFLLLAASTPPAQRKERK